MSPEERGLRVRVINAARRMNASGINQGRSGNVSVRVEGGFLVTPTGVPYESLNVPDLVFMRADGEREGTYKPSSEWRLHRDIYAVMQHVQLAPIWLEAAGRVRLGLPPQHPFFGV